MNYSKLSIQAINEEPDVQKRIYMILDAAREQVASKMPSDSDYDLFVEVSKAVREQLEFVGNKICKIPNANGMASIKEGYSIPAGSYTNGKILMIRGIRWIYGDSLIDAKNEVERVYDKEFDTFRVKEWRYKEITLGHKDEQGNWVWNF